MAAVDVMHGGNSWDMHREPYLDQPWHGPYDPYPHGPPQYEPQYCEEPPQPEMYPAYDDPYNVYQNDPYRELPPRPVPEYEEHYPEEAYYPAEPAPAYHEPAHPYGEPEPTPYNGPMMDGKGKGMKGGKRGRSDSREKKAMLASLMQHNDGPAITPVGHDDVKVLKPEKPRSDDVASVASSSKQPAMAPPVKPVRAAPHPPVPRRHPPSPAVQHLPARVHTVPPTVPAKGGRRQVEKVPTLRMLAQELGMSLSDEMKVDTPSWRTHVLKVDCRHGEVEYYWYPEMLEQGRPVYCSADRGYDLGRVMKSWPVSSAPKRPRTAAPEKGLFYVVLCTETQAEWERTFAEKEDAERRARALACNTLIEQSKVHLALRAMEFTGAKFQHDGRKVTLWYTSTDKYTDYGPLVSPLFRAFGCRIWLQREEADAARAESSSAEEVTAGFSKE